VLKVGGTIMNKFIGGCDIFFAFLGGVLGWAFGRFDSLIYALVAFVLIDYITGILVAFQNKKISSEVGFKGISKKIMMFVLVAVGNIIDQYVIKTGSTLRMMMIMFYLSNEGISIIENAGSIGVPFPQKLKDAIEKLQEK
jgi:toxin secretion/phage lysis holin